MAELISYLPRFYEDIHEARAILSAEYAEIAKLNANIDDVLAQFYVDTATWGLANWERLVGVTVDESKPIDQRRSVIKSKLRGVGTVTVALIKNVAESYSNGEVSVSEDNANYTVTVKFIGKLGVPANMADIQKALRDIIPAHLAINYAFTYVLYDQLVGNFATYDALAASGKSYDDILNGR